MKHYKKVIAIIVIVAFMLHSGGFLLSQAEDEIVKQFIKALNGYEKGQYDNSKTRLRRLVATIKEKDLERKKILGQCHLLLGAIFEKEGDTAQAEKNYRTAFDEYGINSIDGIVFENLPVYEKIKEEKEKTKGVILEPGIKKKKKFPWLMVVGGVVVITVLAIILLKKKKYTLTVDRGEGVEGNYESGVYEYKKGEIVSYSFYPATGYSDAYVTIDGVEAAQTDSIKMDRNHTLRATAVRNQVSIRTSNDEVTIDEGGTGTFRVWLSPQPTSTVEVTVEVEDGEGGINVTKGESLFFTPSDYSTPKEVELEAVDDDIIQAREATIIISAPGSPEVSYKSVHVTVIENDISKNPPIVKITNPKDGAQVSNEVTIHVSAEAEGMNYIVSVEIFIDSETRPKDANPPYRFKWNTIGYINGPHTIRAIAYDNDGGKNHTQITVIVDN